MVETNQEWFMMMWVLLFDKEFQGANYWFLRTVILNLWIVLFNIVVIYRKIDKGFLFVCLVDMFFRNKDIQWLSHES